MSNKRWRCFRDRRRTALRKARQHAAFVEFRQKFPAIVAHTRLGTPIEPRLEYMTPDSKQRLVEGYKRGWTAPR